MLILDLSQCVSAVLDMAKEKDTYNLYGQLHLQSHLWQGDFPCPRPDGLQG